MPRKVFTAGEVLAAADVNTYLMNQAVMTFAGSAARASAISTATATEGMVTYLADTDTFEFWNGTAYASLAPTAPTLEYLVIGGGGGGGRRESGFGGGGGGGAGGYRNNVSGELSGGSAVAQPALALTLGTYSIIVGAGGAGATGNNLYGTPGNRSLLYNISSQGGGGGRSNSFVGNPQGGSGGGGYPGGTTAGLGIVAEGFNGGTGNAAGGGGGGGGAGVTGTNAGVGGNADNGAPGGAGLASSITGSSVTRGGGGGGGGAFLGGAAGSGGGGSGGGGSGAATSGTANTGGGGGGTRDAATGSGGSGLIVFRVPTTVNVSFSGGVTQTNSTISGKKVFVVTATSTISETVTFS